ncbi:MAG: hypothetical protein ACI9EF_002446 [Pseudohongiellaceae bacterium]|jgi:hypothetical protein
MPCHTPAQSNRSFLPWATALVVVLAVVLAPARLEAQIGAVWIPLNSAQPVGTPADIVYDGNASTASDSFFDIFIHGYWQTDVAPGDGNVYQAIEVPGLGRFGQKGAPDLPVARLRLGVPTGAGAVSLVSATDLDPHVIGGLLPYPFTIQELDEAIDPSRDPGPGDANGTPEQFIKDSLIYGGTAAFPFGSGIGTVPVVKLLGGLPGALPEIYPAHWDPTTGAFTISGHLRVHLKASGTATVAPPMTQDRALLAQASLHNWPGMQPWFPVDVQGYEGRYLIVTSAAHLITLHSFIEDKQQEGFEVTVLTLESLAFVTCGEIRGAMDSWYQAGSPYADHYCMLVGDSDVLPLCPSPTSSSVLGDDLYGSPADGDLDEEIYVGRLSVDNSADLANQLAKIARYVAATSGTFYDEALLVAHDEGAPGKYEGAHESVAGASYAVPPSFEKLYGSQANSSNGSVEAAINAGVGVVAYRGHGSEATWSNWNTMAESFHKNDVLALNNPWTLPVVWAFDCWNNRLDFGSGSVDSIGETWLETVNRGAVAHYGSTDLSGTAQNHELDRRMFAALYDIGITRQGPAIAWAEQQMADIQPGSNSWMYLLLGDPAMRVRRTNPEELVLDMPAEITVSGTTPVPIDITVRGISGTPKPGVLVTLFQAGPPGQPPLLQLSAYTGSNGTATFPNGPTSLEYGVHGTGSDPQGNQVKGSSGVVDGAWANFGMALAGTKGVPALLGEGTLVAGAPITLDLTNTEENAPAALFISTMNQPVPFKCGQLQAFPWILLVDLVTDVQGELHLASMWPAGIPADTEFWFQFAVADPGAPCDVAISNVMRGTTP